MANPSTDVKLDIPDKEVDEKPSAPQTTHDVTSVEIPPYVISSDMVTSPGDIPGIMEQTEAEPPKLCAYRKCKNKRGQQLYFLRRDGEPGWISAVLPDDAVLMEGEPPVIVDADSTGHKKANGCIVALIGSFILLVVSLAIYFTRACEPKYDCPILHMLPGCHPCKTNSNKLRIRIITRH